MLMTGLELRMELLVHMLILVIPEIFVQKVFVFVIFVVFNFSFLYQNLM